MIDGYVQEVESISEEPTPFKFATVAGVHARGAEHHIGLHILQVALPHLQAAALS